MPQTSQSLLPGSQGKDYRFVRYGDQVYVVYTMTLPNGREVLTSWKIDKEDYKSYGINLDQVSTISRSQFQKLQYFGNATEITGGDPSEHPFQKYVRSLIQINGNVSWLNDREVMGIMMEGLLEGKSDQEILGAINQTGWYQSRTEQQRNWELNLSKGDRKAAIELWSTQVTNALNALYGPNVSPEDAGVGDVSRMAERIASGKLGEPTQGFETWLAQQRSRAERVEGSQAWIDLQQRGEEQRKFLNRPEDMYEQLRQDAMQWLGPSAVPDDSVLKGWAGRLVSGAASEADWTQYIQQQAKSLYPYLGPNETWQDRASAYKRIVEDTWGMPIGWDDPALGHIGGVGPDGKANGEAMGYDDFTQYVRSQPNFWGGPVARKDGYDLAGYLNSTFNGIQ